MLLRQPCCKVKTDILLTDLAPVQKDIMMLERIRRRATKIISSKKRCLYRLFIYHFKAHTISNKLVSKYLHRRKGKQVMTATNMCSNFGDFRCRPPLMTTLQIINNVLSG